MLDAGIPLVQSGGVFNNSRLYHAAFTQNRHAVEWLLNQSHPVDPHNGVTALHAICWQSDYSDGRNENTRSIVRLLLTAGIRPNARRESDGNTPLHECMGGDGSNLAAAEELLAAGADINAVNNDGLTPLHLHYELLFDYERVVPFMLKHGANPLIRDKHGQTVIDAAERMIAGENPRWREELCADDGGPPCGWKEPAHPDDAEYRMLALLKQAADRFR
ncbi:MAG TPA: ankyrin repeat domain-containing protein [Phycisphaerales bacterium]|nr:ankyrin repeat domain-containing protein [Phycisphaerales bacterium]